MAVNITGRNLFWQARIDNTRLKTDAAKTQATFSQLGKSIGGATLFAGVGVAAGLAIKEVVKVNTAFEKSISTLSSITGAVGEDLDFYKQKAIEFGESTTQSASQVAEAFKLIGSQKPELLQSKEALAEVTQKAIILAQASNVDVPVAARAMTNALNQTSSGAEKASKFINILASASKLGAGDIPYLNSALEGSAKVAHDSNLSFAEMTAVIEKLAPAFSQPSSAGLHFKAVLLRLQKQGFGFESGMFNLQDALNEVKGELDNIKDPARRAQREIKILGARSITAGKIMIESRDSFKEFANSISGTNTAYEQSKINTDNVKGSITKLKSAIEGAILKNSDFNSGLKDIIDTLTGVVKWLGENWKSVERIVKIYLAYKGAVFGVRKAQVLYNSVQKIGLLFKKQEVIATKELTFAQLGLTKAAKSSTIATKGLSKAMKANAIGLIIAGIYAAVEAFKYFNSSLSETENNQRLLNEINVEAEKSYTKQKVSLELLYNAAKDETKSIREREKAIHAINKISPEYLGDIDLEAIKTGKAQVAIEEYLKVLKKKARAQAINHRLSEIEAKLLDIDLKRRKASDYVDYTSNKRELKQTKERLKAINDQIKNAAKLKLTKEQIQELVKKSIPLSKRVEEFEKRLSKGIYGRQIKQLESEREYLQGLIDLNDIIKTSGNDNGGNNVDNNNGGNDTKKTQEENFKLIQEYELEQYKLITDNAEKIKLFKMQQELELLQFKITNSNGIEKEIFETRLKRLQLEYNKEYENFRKSQQINAQKATEVDPLIKAQNDYYNSLIHTDEALQKVFESGEIATMLFKDLGKIIEGSFKDGELSAENFKEVLRSVTIQTISFLIGQAVAYAAADAFKKFGIAGLAAAPVIAGAAEAVLSAIIPKFEKGKPAFSSGGGVVKGYGNKDNQLGMFTPDEVVFNQKHQANLLWNLAQGRLGSGKVESLLKEQNELLRNTKTAVIKDNKMYILKNGVIGEQISL